MTVSLETSHLRLQAGHRRLATRIDLTVKPGQCWGILGPNGCGKTTLLKTLAGLARPAAGHILLEGQNIAQLGRKQIAQKIGVLLQHYEQNFPMLVREAILQGLYPCLDIWQKEQPEQLAKASALLEQVELAHLSGRQITTLSGGEKRRLEIATVLLQSPAIYLLDEPTNHLDVHHQIQLLKLFEQRQAAGSPLVMVLHDINIAARFCTHLLLFRPNGDIYLGRCEELLLPEILEEVFMHRLKTLEDEQGKRYFFPLI